MLDLELTLNGVPDRAWVEAFQGASTSVSLIDGAAEVASPTIVNDTIHWSIAKTLLGPAWWYVSRCVDSANAASFPRERAAHRRPDEISRNNVPAERGST